MLTSKEADYKRFYILLYYFMGYGRPARNCIGNTSKTMIKHVKWSLEQLIMALNVYCKIPFKDVEEWHPTIQKYAPLIGRTSVALKMKVGNFGRFDSILRSKGIVGLGHGSKDEELVWNELWDNPEKFAYESELLFAERASKPIEEFAELGDFDIPKGKDKYAVVRQRENILPTSLRIFEI